MLEHCYKYIRVIRPKCDVKFVLACQINLYLEDKFPSTIRIRLGLARLGLQLLLLYILQ